MCSGPFRGVLNNVQEIWAKCWKNNCKGIPILIKLKAPYLQLYKNELLFKDFMQAISKFQLFAEFPHYFSEHILLSTSITANLILFWSIILTLYGMWYFQAIVVITDFQAPIYTKTASSFQTLPPFMTIKQSFILMQNIKKWVCIGVVKTVVPFFQRKCPFRPILDAVLIS